MPPSPPPPGPSPAVPYARVAAIGAGFLALTLAWSLYNAFMPLLLAEFTASRALRGAVMALDNVLALLLIPFVGAWSDRVRGPLGSRLPFLLVGIPLAAAAFALLPLAAGRLGTLLAVDVAFLLAMTLFRAPVIALMPDHVAPRGRSVANGVINLMGGVGGILALLAIGPLFDRARPLPFALAALALLASLAVLLVAVRRDPPFAEPAGGGEAGAARGALADLRRLGAPEARGARRALLAIALYSFGYSGLEAQFSTWAVEALGVTPGRASTLLGAFSLAFVIAAVPAGWAGSSFGKAPPMRAGLLALAAVFVAAPAAAGAGLLLPALAAGGLAWALVNVQAYPLVADLGGPERIGLFTGAYYLATMSASVLAPPALGLAMDAFGDGALWFAAAAALAAGALALAGVRPPPEARGAGAPGGAS